MKKFAQTAILIAGLTGLSACSTNDVWTPYGSRTAGDNDVAEVTYSAPAAVNTGALSSCQERARRLESMNKTCYRK